MVAPFTRFIVPDSPLAPGTESSYLRLGGYQTPEADLVTGLTTTTSEVKVKTAHPTELDTPVLGSTSSKTSDKEASVKVEPSDPISSDGKGLLAFTNADLNVNVLGASLMKFGAGHTTEVSTADSSYKVLAGTYTLHGENGVFVTAGQEGGQAANIELEASYYIKQTAHGPLSEITWGHSEKRTIGDAMEFFGGTKETCFVGAETTLKLAISTSLFIGLSFTFKISFEFSLSYGYSITIRTSGSLAMTFASKTEFIVGSDFKQVAGTSTKIVIGSDQKLTTNDFKSVLFSDLKNVGGGDIKNVMVNFTKAVYDDKKVLLTSKDAGTAIYKKMIKASLEEIEAETGSLKAVQKKIGLVVT